MVLFIFNVACGWRLSLCFCMGYGGLKCFYCFLYQFYVSWSPWCWWDPDNNEPLNVRSVAPLGPIIIILWCKLWNNSESHTHQNSSLLTFVMKNNFIKQIKKIVIGALDHLSTQTINYQSTNLAPMSPESEYFNVMGRNDGYCFLLSGDLLVLCLLLESVHYDWTPKMLSSVSNVWWGFSVFWYRFVKI